MNNIFGKRKNGLEQFKHHVKDGLDALSCVEIQGMGYVFRFLKPTHDVNKYCVINEQFIQVLSWNELCHMLESYGGGDVKDLLEEEFISMLLQWMNTIPTFGDILKKYDGSLLRDIQVRYFGVKLFDNHGMIRARSADAVGRVNLAWIRENLDTVNPQTNMTLRDVLLEELESSSNNPFDALIRDILSGRALEDSGAFLEDTDLILSDSLLNFINTWDANLLTKEQAVAIITGRENDRKN